MQQMQLAMFFVAVAALVVTGCILTRNPRKKRPTETLRPAVPDEQTFRSVQLSMPVSSPACDCMRHCATSGVSVRPAKLQFAPSRAWHGD
jgi:hypothetical protein